MRRTLLASAILSAFFSLAVHAQSPAFERGFRPDGVYDFSGIDSVDLFNGNVNLSIPIGQSYKVSSTLSYQLTLRYSGAIWDYSERCTEPEHSGPVECRDNTRAQEENGGLGWYLGFGELASLGYYTGADGAVHRFYKVLHDGDAEDAGDLDGMTVSYTRNGSYLRMKALSATTAVIEFPDGQKHRYTKNTTNQRWSLQHIFNGFSSLGADSVPLNNYVAFSYPASPTYAGITDTVITDSAGRTQTIRFKPPSRTNGPARVASVELTKFGSGTAVYTLEYQQDGSGNEGLVIPKPFEASGNVTNPTTAVTSLLSKVHLPSGENYQFNYYIPASVDPESGTLVQMVLPTLGKVEWDYAVSNFVVRAAYLEAVGVSARRIYNYSKTGSPQQTLEQYTKYVIGSGSTTIQTMTGWTDNLGANAQVDDKVTHHFQNSDGTESGLPYAKTSTDSAGRYLSRQMYDCNPSTGICTLERSTYVKFEMDDVDVCSIYQPCQYERNRRPYTENIVYHTDGNRNAAIDLSSFDGLGHYRTMATSGSFGRGDVRSSTTDYNVNTRGGLSVGTYSVDSSGNRLSGFTMLSASDSWVLGTYTGQRVSEGGITAYVQTCFDVAKNFLKRKRVLKSTIAGVNDLLTIYTPDGDGNIIREEAFGGDAQTLPTTALCSLFPPAHTATSSWIEHTYQYGSLASSQYRDTAGGTTGGLNFYAASYDIDQRTGLASRSRDLADLYTDYEYDAMGRVTWVKPQPGHGAWTQYDYRLAANTPSGRAQLCLFQRPNGNPGGLLGRNSVEYDGLGRVYRENQLLANNWWNTKDTRYDHAGRKWKFSSTENYVSDTASPSNWTTTTYDAFDRPRSVTTPDGKVTTFAYTGVSSVRKTQSVGTSASGNTVFEASVTAQQEYDRQGRLWRVTEAWGTTSAATTEYSYDVGCGLSKVCTPGGTLCTQARYFTYDRRGLLTSEQQPEKSTAGNGVASYTYDANGRVLTKTEGPSTANFSLTYDYDRAGRVTQVRETNRSGRVVKQFTFATANALDAFSQMNYKKGRLETATRINYDRAALGFDATVNETYEYSGIGARISRKLSEVRNGATVIASFDQRSTWNELGMPVTVTYPDCTSPASCAASDAGRVVSNVYTNGFLTGVSGYANSISYHPNGMVDTVAHANGLNTGQGINTNAMARPDSFSAWDPVSGAILWTTSGYQYDGAGNIKNIGSNYYVYDRLGRVVEGSSEYVSPSNGKIQRYTYDPYGNMLSMTTLVNGITTTSRTMGAVASTNRLCSGSPCTSGNLGTIDYDDGGNLKTWNTKAYTFDSQNMMATLSDGAAVSYIYTADDERIWAYTSSPSASSRWNVRGLGDGVLREYTTTGTAGAQTWSFAKDYVYRGSTLLAAVANGGAVTHFHLDHLGSTRMVTNASKGIVEKPEYFPFGEESNVSGAETKKFTGHERDYNAASGSHLDYMHARYYSPFLGRFLAGDPVMDVDAALRSPQRWNRYSYVSNDPINKVDTDGREENFYMEQLFREQQMVGEGKMSIDTYWARRQSEGVGALIGLGGAAIFAGGPPAWTAAGNLILRFRIALATLGSGGAVTHQMLQRAAQSNGPTVQVVTNLTRAPAEGRALSAAAGQGAQALANAARSGEGVRTFTANLPQTLITALRQAGLLEIRTTTMNGVTGTEYRFSAGAIRYILDFFREVDRAK